jgi:outer membrane protein OmpA-like peptidoglycan-associated protein
MRILGCVFLLILFSLPVALSQDTDNRVNLTGLCLIEGIATNTQNGNLLPDAVVTIYDDKMQQVLGTTRTDVDGSYKIEVPIRERYRIEADKSTYFKTEKIIAGQERSYQIDHLMMNKPGYMFDVTIFDEAHRLMAINSLRHCKIEIYNNTTKEQELTIPRHTKSVFNFPFVEGNHYTVLVRKPGYINHRIEVYVNINGCILCVHGMGVEQPDVVELMHHGNESGYFLGAIEMDSIYVGKKFAIPNIYYDFDKWNIRADAAPILDKLGVFLKDNPAIQVELGSHTDCRGSDNYNQVLSGRRAESAVNYLVERVGINPNNITFKGYGEKELVNECEDGIKCSEDAHQKNRRTELKVTGYTLEDPLWKYSLKQIIEDKNLYAKIIQEAKTKTKARTLEKTAEKNIEKNIEK